LVLDLALDRLCSGQLTHDAYACSENVLGGQSEHSEEDAKLNVPLSQGPHREAPDTPEKYPPWQERHAPIPAPPKKGLCFPGRHRVQTGAALSEKEPGWQSWQNVEALFWANVPSRQSRQ